MSSVAPTEKRRHNKDVNRLGIVLLDPGSSGSLLTYRKGKLASPVKNSDAPVGWNTPAGVFKTKMRKKLKFKLDEFSSSKVVQWDFNIANPNHDIGYDMIIGRDLLIELGIIIDFKQKTMTWAEATIAMPQYDFQQKSEISSLEYENEPKSTVSMTKRAIDILDVEYAPANLPEKVEKCVDLDSHEKAKLLSVLNQHANYLTAHWGILTSHQWGSKSKRALNQYSCGPIKCRMYVGRCSVRNLRDSLT